MLCRLAGGFSSRIVFQQGTQVDLLLRLVRTLASQLQKRFAGLFLQPWHPLFLASQLVIGDGFVELSFFLVGFGQDFVHCG